MQNNANPYAVVIGGANIDICGAPTNTLIHNDSNIGDVTTSPGGVARNIAENLSLMDIDCRLIAAVGADHYGDLLIEQGESAGIDMTHILRVGNMKTSIYLSVLDNEGDMLVAINDMGIVDHLDKNYLKTMDQAISQAKAIVVDTNLSEDTLAYLMETYADQDIIIDTVSSTKAMRAKPHLNSIHTLKANRQEAEALCGTHDNLSDMATWFHEKGVKRIFITLGSEGVFHSDGVEQGQETMSSSDPVINASGAGDAFVAGITYAWFQGWKLTKSTQFAISAATVALAHKSTINPAMSVAVINKIREQEYE